MTRRTGGVDERDFGGCQQALHWHAGKCEYVHAVLAEWGAMVFHSGEQCVACGFVERAAAGGGELRIDQQSRHAGGDVVYGVSGVGV